MIIARCVEFRRLHIELLDPFLAGCSCPVALIPYPLLPRRLVCRHVFCILRELTDSAAELTRFLLEQRRSEVAMHPELCKRMPIRNGEPKVKENVAEHGVQSLNDGKEALRNYVRLLIWMVVDSVHTCVISSKSRAAILFMSETFSWNFRIARLNARI